MRPPPWRRMCGTAACAQRNAARRSTLTVASQSAAREVVERRLHVHRRHVDQDVETAEGRRRPPAPARRTPPAARDRPENRRAPAAARTPSAAVSASAATRVAERDVDASLAPARSATTRPMRLPPVINATLSVRSTGAGGRLGRMGGSDEGRDGFSSCPSRLPARPALSVIRRTSRRTPSACSDRSTWCRARSR